MSPPTPKKIQTSFDDKISLLDIIHFFKPHKKIILIFMVIGMLMGFFYVKVMLKEPVYIAKAIILPAKVSGENVSNINILLAGIAHNTFTSKKTFETCDPQFHETQDINYKAFNFLNVSVSKDESFIEIKMTNKNKALIHDCIYSFFEDLKNYQQNAAEPIINELKARIDLVKNQLSSSNELYDFLKSSKFKILSNQSAYLATLPRYNIEISMLTNQISHLEHDMSIAKTRPTILVEPIFFERKKTATPLVGVFCGIFLGLCLGIFISLCKQMKG
jgi:hypothetical protein